MFKKIKFICLILSVLCIGYFLYAYNQISGLKLLFVDSWWGAFYLKTYKSSLILGIGFAIATVSSFMKDRMNPVIGEETNALEDQAVEDNKDK